MMRRALVPLLSTLVLSAGALVGAPPASAGNVGTVTVVYDSSSPSFVSFSPTSLIGNAGDTFTLVNTRDNSLSSYVSIANGTGSVSMDGVPCTSSSVCRVSDSFSPPTSATVTIISPGTFTIFRGPGGGPGQIGTLTIYGDSGDSGGDSDPALVYPTAYLEANGGTCSGTTRFTRVNGENSSITLPTRSTCSRTDYTLAGWARSADAASPVWSPGDTVPIGDESFTLYAVWAPTGIEVTYDANVAAADACLAGGVNTSDRSLRVVLPTTGTLATSAPCAPRSMVLRGWRDLATGTVLASGVPVSRLGVEAGARVSLSAQWAVTYGISLKASPTTINEGQSATITVTLTRNGGAAAGATAALSVPAGSGLVFSNGLESAQVTANDLGVTSIVVNSRDVPGTVAVSGAFGDQSSIESITVAGKAAKSIAIVGERGSVSGKPGITIDGTSSGLADGEKVVPWIKFPGETTYTTGSARPAVTDNTFTWSRKTGKKVYVYFTTEDGAVKSNSVIIPAK